MIDIDFLRGWIGKEEVVLRRASADLEARFQALFDRDPAALPQFVFPLSHWLHFLPPARQSDLDADGHPRRGGFLPPVPLPRRMWAGSRVRFHAPIPIDAMMEHRSTIADVRHKSGATGDLVFVTVGHRIVVDGLTAIEDEQDIVYRTPPAPGQAAAAPLGEPVGRGDLSRAVTPDPVMLFRHSALMFNGHRIHYDRDYARDVEGYAGLVIQGPLVAAMLLDHFLAAAPGKRPARFAFRAQRPLLDTAHFEVCLAWTENGARLWTRDADGQATMTAEVEIAEA